MEKTKLIVQVTLILFLLWIFRLIYKDPGKSIKKEYQKLYNNILNSDKNKVKGQWDK